VSERLDRRLVAVMFTDMVGYTALMQTDEHLAVAKRDRYVRALENITKRSAGRSSSVSGTAA
jgi:class 3 adenylate cyclase